MEVGDCHVRGRADSERGSVEGRARSARRCVHSGTGGGNEGGTHGQGAHEGRERDIAIGAEQVVRVERVRSPVLEIEAQHGLAAGRRLAHFERHGGGVVDWSQMRRCAPS